MTPRRATSAVSAAERQFTRSQRLRSGQCYRCFHAGQVRRADEGDAKDGNDQGTPYNTPQGKTRQQRAAMVSEEVKAIARNTPTAKVTGRNAEVDGAQQRDENVSPQAKGEEVPPGRMGENHGPGREGPLAQGVGMVTRTDDEVPDTSRQARGVRTPYSRTEEPTEGGASVLGESAPVDVPMAPPPGNNDTTGSSQATTETIVGTVNDPFGQANATSEGASSTPAVSSRGPRKQQLLELGQNGSTILGGNFAGVVADRMNLVSQPGEQTLPRTPASLKQKLRHRRVVKFQSRAEKDEVDYQHFSRFRDAAESSIIDKMVLGKYDAEGLLNGQDKHKQPVLNEIARMTLKNPTYLSKDGERFLKRVQGLLPAVQNMQAQQRRAGKPAKK